MVDIDDTIIEVHGYTKQGSGYGYSGVRGLNALPATVSTGSGTAGAVLRGGADASVTVPDARRRQCCRPSQA